MTEEFYVGQIFEGSYPPEAANACNQNGWFIDVIGDHRYEIKEIPEPTPPTHEDVRRARAAAYQYEVDPLTSHISRLRDEEQTEEIIAEIEELKAERTAKVEGIKERYPYPDEEVDGEEEAAGSAEQEEIS